jgi:hypothetical protein
LPDEMHHNSCCLLRYGWRHDIHKTSNFILPLPIYNNVAA